MNDFATLKSMSMLALEHDVDFEVFHGKTTHKDKRVRAQMLLSLSGCPTVRISFADKKNDQRVSRVALSGNDRITVKLHDVVEVMKQNNAETQWARLMGSETPLFNISNIGAGLVRVIAKIGEKDEERNSYRISVINTLFNPATGKLVETSPTYFHAVMHKDMEKVDAELLTSGNEVTIVGEYVFPDRIKMLKVQ